MSDADESASDGDEHSRLVERRTALCNERRKKRKGTSKTAEKDNPVSVQKPTKVWGTEVEKLKDLVARIGKGLPGYIGFKIPPNVYRGNPSDEAVQKRIGDFLLAKGLKNISPDDKEIVDFRKKVRHTVTQCMLFRMLFRIRSFLQ